MAYQRRLPILLLTFILCCVIGPGDGKYSLPQRIKRQEPQIENLDGATLFILPNYRGITHPESRAQEREAQDLINLFNNQHVGKTQESNLVRFPRGQTQTLRIDLQGKVNEDYYNLQMQINRHRPSGQSTSVTLVLAPDGISAANMRTAFRRSLTHQAKVCVENGSVATSINCPGSNTGQGASGKGDNNGKGGNNSKGKGKGNNKPRGKVRN